MMACPEFVKVTAAIPSTSSRVFHGAGTGVGKGVTATARKSFDSVEVAQPQSS